MRDTRWLWPLVGLVLCSAACSDDHEPSLVAPPGYAAIPSWQVRHTVEGLDSGGEAIALEAPLLNPNHILPQEPGRALEVGDGLWVAERTAWRVLRYEVTSVDPLVFAPPEVVLSAQPWRQDAIWLPLELSLTGDENRFGLVFARAESGQAIISGPQGRLWAVSVDQPVGRMLGAGLGGRVPDDGVEIGSADLSQVIGAAFDPGGQGRAAKVLLATHNAIFSAPLAALDEPTVKLTRVAGSGAVGQSRGGAAVLSAALDFTDRMAMSVDSQGNLYFTESNTGRVLMIPDYNQPQDAELVIIAGLGNGEPISDDFTDPRNQRLELPIALDLWIHEDGQEVSFDFLQDVGIPWQVRVRFGATRGADFEPLESNFTLEKIRPFSGFMVAQDVMVMGRGDLGTVVSFPLGADADAQERVLAGPEVVESIGPDFLPNLTRPGAVMRVPIFGRHTLIIADVASSKLMLDSGPGQPLTPFIFRSGGTLYDIFRSFAPLSRSDDQPDQVLIGSINEVLGYAIEEPAVGNNQQLLMRTTGGGLSPSGATMASWSAGAAPSLVGSLSDGTMLFFDPDLEGIYTFDAADVVNDATELNLTIGGLANVILPRESPSGPRVVSLRSARSLLLSSADVLTAVVPSEGGGQLIMSMRLAQSQDALVLAGREFTRGQQALVLAGGGQSPLVEGQSAFEMGLTGVSSAWMSPWASLVGTIDVDGRTGLFEVDAEGRFGWLAEPLGEGVVQANPQGEPVALGSLVVSEGARWQPLPCLPPQVALLLASDGVWWVNLSDEEAAPGPMGAQMLEPGTAVALRDGAVDRAVCWLDDAVALVEVGGERLDVLGGQGVALPVAASSLEVTDGGQVLLATERAEGAGALEVFDPGAGLAPTALTGLTPSSLDGRRLRRAPLAASLPVFAQADDGHIYAAMEGTLFRILNTPGERFSPVSRVEVLWTGEPLGVGRDRPTALAALPDDGDGTSILMAARGVVYRFDVDEAQPSVDGEVRRGRFERLAGGGNSAPGFGAPATEAFLGEIEGIVPHRDRIWLRWDGYVGFINAQGNLVGVAGGGDKGVSEAEFPWELDLFGTVGAHPTLSVSPDGRSIVTVAPHLGAVVQFTMP